MVYGHTFYFDQPVRRIWYTYGKQPAALYWDEVVKAALTQPTTVPNEIYNLLAGEHKFTPSVMVVSECGFATEEEAQAWVDGVTLAEINQLSASGYDGKVIRETIINVDHQVRVIRRLRSALTVNAGLYYDKNETAIPDWRWDEMAYQLVALQQRFFYILPFVDFFDFEFNGFDGSTGFDLPYRTEPFIDHIERALVYLEQHRKL